MFTDLVIFMLGGSVGFFTASLCKAASRADEQIEQFQMAPHPINTVDNIIAMEAIDPSEGKIEE
jgi:hypothetical protein